MVEKDSWHRDEYILVMQLYQTEYARGLTVSSPSVVEMSAELRGLPLNRGARGPKYRTPSSVMRRLLNYAHLDGLPGLSGGGDACKTFFQQMRGKPGEISELSALIRASKSAATEPAGLEEETAEEGAILARLHITYERDAGFARRKKASYAKLHGRLSCEACGFDFAASYGQRGEGYAECHHRIPLSKLRVSTPRRLSDLAVLCANCHRMVHRRPWITVDQLRVELRDTALRAR